MQNTPEIFYDLETHWAAGYSLSCMNVFEYMADPRFELISMTAELDGRVYQSWGHEQTLRLMRRLPFARCRAVAHNGNEFDHLVLKYVAGVEAAEYADTLCMARPFHNRVGLGSLAEEYGIGQKNNAILLQTKGKRAADFTRDEITAMLEYNKTDAAQLKMLYWLLRGRLSESEMGVIGMTAKMACQPRLVADRELLAQTLWQVQEQKEAQLRSLFPILGTDSLADTRSALMSAAKFGRALQALGVEVPVKESPSTPGKFVPALAKTDAAFQALQYHPDERVTAMVAARLGAKSTLLESRIQTMLAVTSVTGGALPVTLAYYGADQTGRYSGRIWNPQNLPRVSKKKPRLTDALRRAIMAPDGKVVVVRDLSGIELRTNMTLAGQWDMVDILAAGGDLYCHFAGEHLYHRTVTEDDAAERAVGKVSHLSLGYGAGARTFADMCRIQGVTLDLTPESVVKAYRTAMYKVVEMWASAQKAIPSMLHDGGAEIDELGLIRTVHQGILLPSGRVLRYPNLRKETNPDSGREEWVCDASRGAKRLYGGMLVENINQAVARDIITDHALEINAAAPVGHVVHDEIVCVVDEADGPDLLSHMGEVMARPLEYWPELPLASKGDVAKRYGDAK